MLGRTAADAPGLLNGLPAWDGVYYVLRRISGITRGRRSVLSNKTPLQRRRNGAAL